MGMYKATMKICTIKKIGYQSNTKKNGYLGFPLFPLPQKAHSSSHHPGWCSSRYHFLVRSCTSVQLGHVRAGRVYTSRRHRGVLRNIEALPFAVDRSNTASTREGIGDLVLTTRERLAFSAQVHNDSDHTGSSTGSTNGNSGLGASR